ncbi:unnamed protein product [Ectocarpus sp. 12 AP-2014]
MRALMERLCWILAAMTVGLHEAIARLQPRNAWDNTSLLEDKERGGHLVKGNSHRSPYPASQQSDERCQNHRGIHDGEVGQSLATPPHPGSLGAHGPLQVSARGVLARLHGLLLRRREGFAGSCRGG